MSSVASSPSPAASSASSLPSYPFLTQGPGCVVCSEALITGPHPIRLGAGCIVHPRARLDSSRGPITLGANNVLEEGSTLRAVGEQGVKVGDSNVIRVGACVEADLGSANVIGCRAHITQAGGVGDGCLIGAMLVVEWPVPSHSVMYGGGRVLHAAQRQREEQRAANVDDANAKGEVLRDMLRKTHRMIY